MQTEANKDFQEQQSWQPSQYATDGGYVAALGAEVLEMLAPRKGEHILDIGCGDGVLSEKIMQSGAKLQAIDSSPEMVTAAQDRGVKASVMDAQLLTFDGEFDAVFSNAALHWMPDFDHVAKGIFHALKPGGRFVGEFGGHGNVAALRVAVRAAFEMVTGNEMPPDHKYYPTKDEYRAVLQKAGFDIDYMEIIPRPTPLPAGLEGWLKTFGGRFFAPLNAQEKTAVVEKAIALASPELRDENGNWTADYIRLRFRAKKPRAENLQE